jgi:hypothetical protein
MRVTNYLLLAASTVILSCGGKAEESKGGNTTGVTTTPDFTVEEAVLEESNLQTLRFRLDMLVANHGTAPVAMLLKLSAEDKDVFHPDYVNDVNNVSLYKDDFSTSLNFGVYKTDLIYDLLHHHLDDGINAREAANTLADALWDEHIYSDDDIEKYREAQDNFEFLERLLIEDYEKTEKYLISHDQFEIATLTMIGSLIESMYFTSKAIEEFGMTDPKYDLLINEKHQLDEFVELLAFFKGNEKDKDLLEELMEVEEAYGNINEKEDLTDEVIKKIDSAVFTLREKVVSNNV